MEKPNSSSADVEDDEDYNLFGLKRTRNKRRAVIDDDDDDDDCQVETTTCVTEDSSNKVDDAGSQEETGCQTEVCDLVTSKLETGVKGTKRFDKLSNTCDTEKFVLTSDIFDADISDEDTVTHTNHDDTSAVGASAVNDSQTGEHGDNFQHDSDSNDGNFQHDSDSNDGNFQHDSDSSDGNFQRDSDSTGGNFRHDSDNNEEFNESEVDADLLAKLRKMKGASKSSQERKKYSRKAKPSAEKMMEIYSDSQRLLRDSRVSLPYHQPELKLLDDFLTRAAQKRQEYAGLRKAKDIQKAQIILDKFSVPAPTVSSSSSKKRNFQLEASENTKSSCAHNLANSKPDPVHDLHALLLPASDCSLLQARCALQTSGECMSINNNALPDIRSALCDTFEPTSNRTEITCDSVPVDRQAVESVNLIVASSQETDTEVYIPPSSQETNPEVDIPPSNQETNPEVDIPPSNQETDPAVDIAPVHGNLFKPETCEREQTLHSSQVNLTQTEEVTHMTSESSQVNLTHTEEVTHMTSESSRGMDARICTSDGTGNEVRYPSFPATPVCSATSVAPATPVCSATSVSPATPVCSSTSVTPVTLPVSRIVKSHILHRLEGLGLSLSPSLSGTSDGTICLDDSSLELVKLSPLVQPSTSTPTPVHITPCKLDGDKLMSDCVMEEKHLDNSATGCKLNMLKQQLGVSMRKKRAEARQRRLQLFALENEEGFEREENEESEIEGSITDDEDGTDRSDSDEDGAGRSDDDGEEDDLFKLNMDENESDDNDYNPLLDNEAKEDEDDDDSCSDVHLHFDVSEDEEDSARKDGGKTENCDMEHEHEVEQLTNDETSGETLLTCQRRKKRKPRPVVSDDDEQEHSNSDDTSKNQDPDLTSCSVPKSTESTLWLQEAQQERFRGVNSCSPDLYSTGLVDDTSQPPTDSTYTPQSQMLTADGFLKVTEFQPVSRMSLLAQSSDTDDRQSGSQLSMSAGHIFNNLASQTAGQLGTEEDNMKQLLALCSGHFGAGKSLQCPETSQMGATHSFPVQADTADDDVVDPFHVLSDSEDDLRLTNNSQEDKTVLSGSDDDQSDTDDQDNTSTSFTGLKKTRQKYNRRQFLDEEAELSGSEFDSDEDLDLAEEDDVLEEEEGDRDLQGVSEEKLRDEVGRLHMKRLQDDDDREVMRFKEMYLQDGDLYSEGGGRMRNFRWTDIDQTSQSEIVGQNSDDEQAGDDIDDVHWRKDRFDREQFLAKEDFSIQAEDSQVLKLGQFFMQKQDSIPLGRGDDTPNNMKVPSSLPKATKSGVQKRGSFLSRGQETLVKIAEVVKATGGAGSGKNSKHFIFQTVDDVESDSKKHETSRQAVPGKRKSHSTSCSQQPSKKAKPSFTKSPTFTGDKKSQPSQTSSIFQLIDM